MAATVTTPYSGAVRLINTADIPTWMNEYDAARIASYKLYEDIYWTNPLTFKLQQRGSEENPIYIPSGRVIINTMDRYAGVEWSPVMDPAFGTPEQQAAALQIFRDFFKRERMGSQYDSNKLFGIMRGDWFWYITVQPEKPQFSRLTVRAIDPAMVFPINDDDDVDRIFGYDLVEQITIGSDLRVKRTRYLKSESPDHPSGSELPGGPISYQVDAFEIENWETEPKAVAYDQAVPPTLLHPLITMLPIYHIKNFEEPQNPFGSSEMRGIERVMAAVNQSITDEELSLALEGLGMYKSGRGQPKDSEGNPTTWQLGPGRVVHDDTFERVNGINTVGPFQEHLKYLHGQLDEATGTSDVAKGTVDVTVAESGIALRLRMSPILSSSKKKDTVIREVMDNFLFDLRAWFKAYEGTDMEAIRFNSQFGDKLPRDDQARFDNLLKMFSADPPLITADYFRDACREMGMQIPIDVTNEAIAEEQAMMTQNSDPFGAAANAATEAEAAAGGSAEEGQAAE